MVDGAALEKRCAKAPRVRIPPSPPPHPITRTGRNLGPMASRGSAAGLGATAGAPRYPVDSGRGRLVDYGAALEMRFGATRRGFESRPLRHTRVTPGRPMPALTPAVLAHAPHRSATRPSCHPTVNYADRDDFMARVGRLLPPIEAIDVRNACPDARYAGSTVVGPAASGHTVVAKRVIQGRPGRSRVVHGHPGRTRGVHGRLGRRRGQAHPRPASTAHV